MCLFKDKKFHPHNRPLIVEEDVVCYKQLEINYFTKDYISDFNTVYMTPYEHLQVPKECLTRKVPFKAEILNKFKFIWKHVLGFSNKVTDGFIHTYKYLPKNTFGYITFKCIIPKGTKYFVGSEGHYASERIIFLEKLK